MLSPDQIGPAIRSLRESRGYSQEYMADRLDISQSNYACLESGKTAMRVDRLLRIMDILETDPTQLLNGASHHADQDQIIYPEVKEVYEKLISEMKEEIAYLRTLVK